MAAPLIPQKYAGEQEYSAFPLNPGDGREGVSLLGSMNMEITPDGATPAFDIGSISGGGDKYHYWYSPLESQAPNGNPRQYVATNDQVWRFEDGALTLDVDHGSGLIHGLTITDDAVTPPNKRLIAWFGDSTAGSLTGGGHAWRNLGTDTTPWTFHIGATALTAFGGQVVGSDTFLIAGSAGQGRSVLGEHKVTKVPAGSFDGTTTLAGPAEPVGNSGWAVFGYASFRGSPTWAKGDGAYYRNSVDKRYDPIRALATRLPHGLNAKVMAPSENGVIYADVAGRLYEWNGQGEREITPLKDSRKPKDTQRGRIQWVADRGDVLAVGYAAHEAYIKGPIAAAKGVRIFKRTGAGQTWTEITSGVTDGSLITPATANMSAWGANSTDRLLVISPFPLAGIIPRVTREPNAAVNSFTNPQGSGGGAETAGALSVDLGTVRDATILTTAGISLVFGGFPAVASEPFLGWTSISAFADVLSTDITVTGIATITGFGYEWSPATTTAMTTPTTIDEIDFIPGRPGLGLRDPNGPFTAANDFSSLWASGMLEEVYFGRRVGYGEYEWSNPYVINSGGGTHVASWTAAATGTMTNGGMALITYGRFDQFIIAEGVTRDPRRQKYPKLAPWSTTKPGPRLTINNMAFRHSDGSFADPLIPKKILGVEIDGRDIPIDDFMQVWFDGLDGRPAWKYRTYKGTAPGGLIGSGGLMRRGTMHLLYADINQTDEWAPLIERIRVRWQYVGVELKDQPALASGSKALS